MYSRFSTQTEKPIQIPEHYSGCAFPASKRAPSLGAKQPPTFLDVATPTPPPPADLPPPAEPREEKVSDVRNTPVSASVSEKSEPQTKHAAPVAQIASPFSALFGNIGHAFPFSHGIGFEELLLLGLIVLLSRNEGESDVILLLGLLLFCG